METTDLIYRNLEEIAELLPETESDDEYLVMDNICDRLDKIEFKDEWKGVRSCLVWVQGKLLDGRRWKRLARWAIKKVINYGDKLYDRCYGK